MNILEIEGRQIKISHPDKILFPKLKITKLDYINSLIKISPYLLEHTTDRALTSIRFPNGADKKSFYQKRPPVGTPKWVDVIKVKNVKFINLNSLATLIWLANLAVLEFHMPFCKYNQHKLDALVFDLDPSKGQNFGDVTNCSLKINMALNEIGIKSLVKTSGATGLQIFIPVNSISFERGRKINEFFAIYFTKKYPKLMTIERLKKNRDNKLYFDYLQMWRGKNMISVYSPRAVSDACISMPLTWNEVEKGIKPRDYNLLNAADLLKKEGTYLKRVKVAKIKTVK